MVRDLTSHNLVARHIRRKLRNKGEGSVAEWAPTYRKSDGSNPSSHFPTFKNSLHNDLVLHNNLYALDDDTKVEVYSRVGCLKKRALRGLSMHVEYAYMRTWILFILRIVSLDLYVP